MRAVVLHAVGDVEHLCLEERPDPYPDEGEAVVRLRAAALNHRDVWIRKGQYAGIKVPIILGSDGAGEVVEVGAGVDSSWLGREVVIDPSFNWGPDDRAQDTAFHILGDRIDFEIGDDEGGGGDAAANSRDEYSFAGLHACASHQRTVCRHRCERHGCRFFPRQVTRFGMQVGGWYEHHLRVGAINGQAKNVK